MEMEEKKIVARYARKHDHDDKNQLDFSTVLLCTITTDFSADTIVRFTTERTDLHISLSTLLDIKR